MLHPVMSRSSMLYRVILYYEMLCYNMLYYIVLGDVIVYHLMYRKWILRSCIELDSVI